MNENTISPDKTVQITEEGYVIYLNQALTDKNFIDHFFQSLEVSSGLTISQIGTQDVIVESFDQVLVANNVEIKNDKIILKNYYSFEWELPTQNIFADDYDRFIGLTHKGISFTIAGKAQEQLFNLCDSYDDDSITINGAKITIPYIYEDKHHSASANFWTSKYNESEIPPWDLNQVHPSLVESLKQLKLLRSRILVLGCGRAHDAAFLAQQGHIVTAIDISPEAINRAEQLYGKIENLNFVEADVFKFIEEHQGQFDIVFDHTFYCAIPPEYRKKLVSSWKKAISDDGHILGIFFHMFKPDGPPFGGSEWDLYQKTKKDFKAVYWNRIRLGSKNRLGFEFLIYAQKQ